MRMNKKAQVIENLQALVVPLVAIAILLAVGLLIMGEVKTQAINNAETISENNVTITITRNVSTIVDSGCVYENDITIDEAYNGTTGADVLLGSGNYTGTGNGINISDSGVTGFSASANISYTCSKATYAVNGTRSTQNATSDIPGWLPIIVITVIGAILIGLVGVFRNQ